MELLKRLGMVAAAAIVGVYLLTTIGRLVSSKSDFGVAAGVVLAVGLIVGLAWVAITHGEKVLRGLGLLATAFLFIGCGCTRVEPGYVGLRVNLSGSDRGVEENPIETGWVFYNPISEQVYEFPTFVQRYVWTSDDREGSPTDESITFNSSEGAVMQADVGIAVKFDATAVPALFVEFRREPDAIVRGWVRDRVRDAMNAEAAKIKAVDLLSSHKETFMESVNETVRAELGLHGIVLDRVTLLARPQVDPQVEASINAVISATQKAIEAQNRVVQTKAEADQMAAAADGERRRLMAEAEGRASAVLAEAKAQAEANDLVARSLSPALIEWRKVERWNGTVPQVTSESVVPFVQTGAK